LTIGYANNPGQFGESCMPVTLANLAGNASKTLANLAGYASEAS